MNGPLLGQALEMYSVWVGKFKKTLDSFGTMRVKFTESILGRAQAVLGLKMLLKNLIN